MSIENETVTVKDEDVVLAKDENDDEDYVLTKEDVPFALIYNPLFMLANWALEGVIGLLFWGFFMVPLGLPVIGFWHAMGLLFTVELVTMKLPKKEDMKVKPKDMFKRQWFFTKALVIGAILGLICYWSM